MWRVALAMIRDYPLAGAGLYTFQEVSRINYVFRDVGAEIEFVHAHNLFLQAGVSFGLPGLLALLGLWGTALTGLWAADRQRPPSALRDARLFGAALAGFLAFGLLDVISVAQRPGILIWIVLGGVAVLLRQQQPSWRPPSWLLALPLLLLLLLSVTPALPRNVARLKLDRAQLQLEVPSPALAAGLGEDARRLALLAYLQGDDQTALRHWSDDADATPYLRQRGFLAQRNGDAAAAIGWYDMALALDPTLAQVIYWRGQARETLGQFEAALGDYASAVHLVAEQGADKTLEARMLYYFGRALLRAGEVEQAVVVLQRAVARDENQAAYYRQLGDALLAAGDEQAAAAAYERGGGP
jgi:tetratricopeptide (TPR) repeat protein